MSSSKEIWLGIHKDNSYSFQDSNFQANDKKSDEISLNNFGYILQGNELLDKHYRFHQTLLNASPEKKAALEENGYQSIHVSYRKGFRDNSGFNEKSLTFVEKLNQRLHALLADINLIETEKDLEAYEKRQELIGVDSYIAHMNRTFVFKDLPRDGSPKFVKNSEEGKEADIPTLLTRYVRHGYKVQWVKEFPAVLEDKIIYLMSAKKKENQDRTKARLKYQLSVNDKKIVREVEGYYESLSEGQSRHKNNAAIIAQLSAYHDFKYCLEIQDKEVDDRVKILLSTLMRQNGIQSELAGMIVDSDSDLFGVIKNSKEEILPFFDMSGRFTVSQKLISPGKTDKIYTIDYVDTIKFCKSSDRQVISKEGLIYVKVDLLSDHTGNFSLNDLSVHVTFAPSPQVAPSLQPSEKLPAIKLNQDPLKEKNKNLKDALALSKEDFISAYTQQTLQSDKCGLLNDDKYLRSLFKPLVSSFSDLWRVTKLRIFQEQNTIIDRLSTQDLQALILLNPEKLNFLFEKKPWYVFWQRDYLKELTDPKSGSDLFKGLSFKALTSLKPTILEDIIKTQILTKVKDSSDEVKINQNLDEYLSYINYLSKYASNMEIHKSLSPALVKVLAQKRPDVLQSIYLLRLIPLTSLKLDPLQRPKLVEIPWAIFLNTLTVAEDGSFYMKAANDQLHAVHEAFIPYLVKGYNECKDKGINVNLSTEVMERFNYFNTLTTLKEPVLTKQAKHSSSKISQGNWVKLDNPLGNQKNYPKNQDQKLPVPPPSSMNQDFVARGYS